ncbi:hypothetical protein WL29_20535 [Burkholderia ubonensis]|uniref:Uncharacterized protein n=1 Tax=Burkholderia ubonensis TaxID=101571 RepID=A0A106QCV2_9BURK|nr:hypothetical protein [Burkholderia ubonensis]KWA83754.1 hypothetical protein WL29_20535 [Burkholderia ubonensis]
MRTSETVREAAARHFASVIEMAERYGQDVAAARAEEVIGMRIVDAALATPAGDVLKLGDHLPADRPREETFAEAMRVMPFICGAHLRLLDMEFAHETLGVVPYTLVSKFMNGSATEMMHEGVKLTPQNVFLQYRRRALD